MVGRRAFGGHLTSGNGGDASGEAAPSLSADAPTFVPGQPVAAAKPGPSQKANPPKRLPQRRNSKSSAQDLPTRIHEDINNGQYECVICTSEVWRDSKIWSCTICSTVVHMHCVRKWHKNQTQAQEENQNPNANQPPGTWRCPGCNSSLQDDPGAYHCWCGKEQNPKSIPGLSPHSCGQTCSKKRPTCPHPCSLTCHAGPCPPCNLMGPTQSCYCGKNTSTKRCSETNYGKGWSCQEICGDLLPCGEHTCSQPCHSGLCGGCDIPIPSFCYCGKTKKDMPCDQRDTPQESYNYGQLAESDSSEEKPEPSTTWFEGCFECSKECGRKFDCGHHTCRKDCHVQDEEAAHCPLSPDVVTHCPCGKSLLQEICPQPRTSCQDPIPHCNKPCDKLLSCGHHCPDKCHTGPCRPCMQNVDISCRCGRTTVKSVCHQGDIQPPMCFRICRAQLNCGRHECGEHCCPGEKKATERRKQKRNANENFEAEHICLNPCGRTLRCGKHTCQQLCHRGQCPSCLEAVFDEISCACGRTVLQPPQPCGTRPPECRFDCTRARACGHPTVPHQCHPADVDCPNCPFLVEKPCICGKKMLKNQPCYLTESRCGLPCEKKLKCGVHECRKLCHRPGECEDAGIPGSHCAQPCGKVRKSCDHTCSDTCHAPYACKEDKPCQSKTFVTCPCQHRKQEIKCQATWTNPSAARETLKCDDECLRLQRNRLLANALNIDPATHTDDHIPYSATTLKLYRENPGWAQTQEREFRVFADDSDEKRMRFKPMPAHQRAFLHSLAEDFGLDSESQDPEPHRHIAIFKTPRFVSAPKKTLAQSLRLAKVTAPPAPTVTKPTRPDQEPFNALLLTAPRFGLTTAELETALSSDISPTAHKPITFTTAFLSDEILIKAHAQATAAAIATSSATPQAVEAVLKTIRPSIARKIASLNLAGSVLLCTVDSSGAITRREGGATEPGWSAVAGRGSWRPRAAEPAPAPAKKGFGFVALRKLGNGGGDKGKEKVKEAVVEDWEAEVERDEKEASASGSGDEKEAEKEAPVEAADVVADEVTVDEIVSTEQAEA